jgi:hypothetical protein
MYTYITYYISYYRRTEKYTFEENYSQRTIATYTIIPITGNVRAIILSSRKILNPPKNSFYSIFDGQIFYCFIARLIRTILIISKLFVK